jgi:P-type E1-E2 ATPase
MGPIEDADYIDASIEPTNIETFCEEILIKIPHDHFKRLKKDFSTRAGKCPEPTDYDIISVRNCKASDRIFVEKGDLIPIDGKVIEGVALVDESAITGESAPVIRESDSERNRVIGGTRVFSDWLVLYPVIKRKGTRRHTSN